MVTYLGDSVRVSFLFAVGGTDELAVTDLTFADASAPSTVYADPAAFTDAQCQAFLNDYFDLMSAMQWADYSDLVGLKIAVLDTAGHYLYDPRVYADPSPASGTQAGSVLPQSTVVLSLRSGASLGKGNYGRMYLPHTQFDLATGTPMATVARAATAASTGAAFIAAATTDARVVYPTVDPVIMGSVTSSSPGSIKAVTQVAVGRVTDTQRRRRNGLDEGYQFASV